MKCPSFDELMAFSDGELDRGESARVEAHVSSCPRCASIVSSQARMEGAWRDSYREPRGDHFERLEREIRSRYPVRRRSPLQWAVPIAAALLVAIAGVKFMGGNGRLARETGPAAPPDAGFSGELTADGTRPQSEDLLAVGDSAGPGSDLEQAPALPTVETDALAAPETVVVTGSVDDVAGFAQPGTASSGRQAGYGDLLEIGTIEAQTGGSLVMGADRAAAECQGALAVGQQAPYGGGGASPAGGAGGLEGGDSFGISGLGGEAAADLDACEPCFTEEQEEQVLLPFDSAGLEVAQTCEECPAFSGSTVSTPDTNLADGANLESRSRTEAGLFLLFFDGDGNPASPDAVVLDEAFPGWKDSLRALCSDSVLVVSADEMSEMMLE